MSDSMQKDLVLSVNEYAYVLDETKGHVSCLVGPTKMSLSQSDRLVRFDTYSKSFVAVNSMEKAKSLFTTIPEGWYCIMKNPTEDGRHPTPGTSNNLPDNIQIGKKVNLCGPASFALYPGQMARVIRGHALRSNQYLLARVYEAEEANKNYAIALNADGEKIEETTRNNYVNGQILVIKGTEISFYIPPTGIEVIPVNNDIELGYTRDAVTLERLEYCILKDENGTKKYVHGPAVVFPEPTETFITSPKGGYIYRAIELSPISGIYVKVIAEYTDDQGVEHPIGEEMFITGNDQMIYYPRPEHALISYNDKFVHHATAIPEGEGRYVMDRLTGKIETVRGPVMLLPDPRTQVIVKRKLSDKECSLWYPGNKEALAYNQGLDERSVEKALKQQAKSVSYDDFAYNTNACLSTTNCSVADKATLAYLETNANISRGTSYTKPRTITLDTKYDGVVSLNIWTGYAVNVVSKNGERKIVCGPQTVLLDYDQTLEVLQLSTGKPKTTDKLLNTVYLRYENNKVSDIIEIETKDFVRAKVKVSYCVDFDLAYQDKWFAVDNYVKYLCDRERSRIKRVAKCYTIEEFYQNYADIVRETALDVVDEDQKGLFFEENGMRVKDCEVLSLDIQAEVADILETHQMDMVAKNLELTDAEARIKVAKALAEAEKEEAKVASDKLTYKLELQQKEATNKMALQAQINRQKEAEALAAKQAEKDMQVLIDAVFEANMARKKKETDAEIEKMERQAEVEKAKKDAYAETVSKIMSSISDDLVAALSSKANAGMLESIATNLSPYAMAKGESVADFTDTLLRGTNLADILRKLNSDNVL